MCAHIVSELQDVSCDSCDVCVCCDVCAVACSCDSCDVCAGVRMSELFINYASLRCLTFDLSVIDNHYLCIIVKNRENLLFAISWLAVCKMTGFAETAVL